MLERSQAKAQLLLVRSTPLIRIARGGKPSLIPSSVYRVVIFTHTLGFPRLRMEEVRTKQIRTDDLQPLWSLELPTTSSPSDGTLSTTRPTLNSSVYYFGNGIFSVN